MKLEFNRMRFLCMCVSVLFISHVLEFTLWWSNTTHSMHSAKCTLYLSPSLYSKQLIQWNETSFRSVCTFFFLLFLYVYGKRIAMQILSHWQFQRNTNRVYDAFVMLILPLHEIFFQSVALILRMNNLHIFMLLRLVIFVLSVNKNERPFRSNHVWSVCCIICSIENASLALPIMCNDQNCALCMWMHTYTVMPQKHEISCIHVYVELYLITIIDLLN